MGKSKKISFTSIAIVVLAILLTVSLTMGGTLAWFANQNQADVTLTMGNAVGVAVVDNKGNGSMDKLSFKFNTGRNGELMLPGTQIDPNVQALIAQSNTNVILRAVVAFQVSLNPTFITPGGTLSSDNKTAIETATGQKVVQDATDGKYYITVPSSVVGDANGTIVERELYLLNQMYTSFFATLQSSALFNGWVYRESNQFGTQDTVTTDSAANASTKYYAAGYTQYANTPIVAKAARNAGPERLQNPDATDATNKFTEGSTIKDPNVSYNAFYFRGWATQSTMKEDDTGADKIALPTTIKGKTVVAYDGATGTGWKLEDRGIDGYYAVEYDKGSRTGSEDYIEGTGRLYRYDRYGELTNLSQSCGDAVYAGAATTANNQYAVLEGTYDNATNGITKTKDQLGFKAGDVTGQGTAGTVVTGHGTGDIGMVNVAGTISADQITDPVNNTDKHYTGYCWATAGAQTAGEDMMCVINTLTSMARVPLFTTSFILPPSWTQDAFADRSMKLDVTFQVMQADYLASGVSHHCSVELAESRFDDVTIWTEGNPYVKDVDGQPNYDNPDFWNGAYADREQDTPENYIPKPTPTPGGE